MPQVNSPGFAPRAEAATTPDGNADLAPPPAEIAAGVMEVVEHMEPGGAEDAAEM